MKKLAPALALFVLGLTVAASAQTRSPDIASPLVNLSALGPHDLLPPALPPRADGVPPDLAFGAYQRGNFLYALLEAERRLDANPKDAAAMTLIGEIYRDGAAVTRDDREASRWYRLASNLGDPQAAYELGALLLEGANGVAKDAAAAKTQFERAAAKNHPAALYNLGVMALQGPDGKTPDYAGAAQYFLRAANAGDDNAAYSYGVMLREGKGAPQDIIEAAHWLKRAADGGIIAGQVEYAIMLFNGDGVRKDEAGAAKILADRRRARQPDRPEPNCASLRRRPGVAARPCQGRCVEQLRQSGGTPGSRARCRHRRSDARRAPAFHQARS